MIVVIALSLTTSARAFAQVTDTNKAVRDQVNETTVFVAGGSLGATYNSLANDIGMVTSDDKLRVISVTTSTGVQNVRDLVYLRSIDLAFTNVRVLNGFLASGELGPDLKRQIVYIAPLTTEEAHVLVQPEINSLEELRGKRVSFHIAGSSSALAGAYIFKALGIDVKVSNFAQPDAIEKMRLKELDAWSALPKIVPAYATLKPDAGFKFVEVPIRRHWKRSFCRAGSPARTIEPGAEGQESADRWNEYDSRHAELAEGFDALQSERQVRGCFLLEVSGVLEASSAVVVEDGEPGRHGAWVATVRPCAGMAGPRREQTAVQMRSRFDQFLSEQTRRGDAGPVDGNDCSASSRTGCGELKGRRPRSVV
jgi:hypothetical protein